MPDTELVNVLIVSIGTTCNGYVLKWNTVSTVFTNNSTPYFEVTRSASLRNYHLSNKNTSSAAVGLLFKSIETNKPNLVTW